MLILAAFLAWRNVRLQNGATRAAQRAWPAFILSTPYAGVAVRREPRPDASRIREFHRKD
jgi:hypothetical protein